MKAAWEDSGLDIAVAVGVLYKGTPVTAQRLNNFRHRHTKP